MTREDNLSFSQEYYLAKNKCEKYKIDIQDFKQDLNKLRNIEVKHDILHERLGEI